MAQCPGEEYPGDQPHRNSSVSCCRVQPYSILCTAWLYSVEYGSAVASVQHGCTALSTAVQYSLYSMDVQCRVQPYITVCTAWLYSAEYSRTVQSVQQAMPATPSLMGVMRRQPGLPSAASVLPALIFITGDRWIKHQNTFPYG